MKTPKWETGLKGAIWKDGKMMTADANVTPGMRVTAQCKGEIINLRISEEIESRVFKAVVMGDYFLNEADALSYGDEITISREFILWLHGKD